MPVERDGFLIECFHYVDGHKQDVYYVEQASTWPSETLGAQVVAIASDGSGDQLILLREGARWKIAWWRHDTVPSLLPIADSFGELLQMLVADPLANESVD